MISSMTGFGKGSAFHNGTTAEVEIKSVNSRFLEISLKLPKNLQNKEYDVRELIRKKINRGKITLIVQLKKDETEAGKIHLNEENLSSALGFLKELKKKSKVKDDISLNHILMFRDIFFAEETDESEEEFKLIQKSINEALNNLNEMRKREGEELSIDLNKRIKNIEKTVDKIEEASKIDVKEYFEKVKERAKQMLGEISAYNERIELELALLIDKSDVTEECVRLRSHTKFFLDALKNENEVGRKLNFLCQEINREANTIGSKSLSSEISHSTVFIKEELEKIREQVQNIE